MSKSEQPRYLDGEALYRKRAEAGLEQAQLAEKCGFTQGQISGWERGHTGCRLATLHKLAQALGCSPLDLLRSRDSKGSAQALRPVA